MSEVSEASSQDPLYEYKQLKREEYEGRNLMRVGTHHVLQDDVYTTLEAGDSTPGSLYQRYPTGTRQQGFFGSVKNFFSYLRSKLFSFSNFLVPGYSNFSVSEATSTAVFFGVIFFLFVFLFLSLF